MMTDPRLADWNERLQIDSRDLANKRQWTSKLERVRQELDRQRQLERSCMKTLENEEQDVERLKQSSLAQF